VFDRTHSPHADGESEVIGDRKLSDDELLADVVRRRFRRSPLRHELVIVDLLHRIEDTRRARARPRRAAATGT
jgi:hypothetical protein